MRDPIAGENNLLYAGYLVLNFIGVEVGFNVGIERDGGDV